MFKAEVLGPWYQIEDSMRPSIVQDYSMSPGVFDSIKSLAQFDGDVLAPPNLNVWLIICNQTTLDALEADQKYEILSSEEIIEEGIL